MNIEGFTNEDFTLLKDANGDFIGGGYTIDSQFLNAGVSPINTFNTSVTTGGADSNSSSSSSINLAVPAGLFFINQKIPKQTYKEGHYPTPHLMVEDNLLEKLLELTNIKEINNTEKEKGKGKHTKKHKYLLRKKTRKSS